MLALHGKLLFLRALEPEDLDFLYAIENDEAVWALSNTITPFSRFLLKQYLDNAHLDLFEAKQLRLVICCAISKEAMGFIDLFDFDPLHRRAGVGIVIKEPQNRGKGYGSEALELVVDYAFKTLQLHQLYANIGADNTISTALFTTFGFQKIGVKKDWVCRNGRFFDEAFYQLIQQ